MSHRNTHFPSYDPLTGQWWWGRSALFKGLQGFQEPGATQPQPQPQRQHQGQVYKYI